MSYQRIARKDFEDVIRSWMFWTIISVSLLLMVIVAFGASTNDLDTGGPYLVYMLFNSLGAQIVLPVMGLVFGYMAITGERESGSLRVLFGLSHDRRDVLFGKLLSRSAAMVVGALVACVVVAGLVFALFDDPDLGVLGAFVAFTVLLALTFTGIAIGVSSMTGTRARSMGAAIGIYVTFLLMWYPFVAILHYLVEGELAGYAPPDWYLFLLAINPLTAYREAIGGLVGEYFWSIIGWPNIVADIPQETIAQESLLLADRAGGDPFYATVWFAALVLLFWFAVPVAVGYWRFENADLN
jgi:ABC-2 type transport system permease protein